LRRGASSLSIEQQAGSPWSSGDPQLCWKRHAHFPGQGSGVAQKPGSGDKVRFEVERDGRSFVVTRVVNSN